MAATAGKPPLPRHATPSDLAWRVLGLVNLYRLLVATGLFVAARFDTTRELLDIRHPGQMLVICGVYLLAGTGLILLRRVPHLGLRPLALSHAIVDSVAIGFILWASGGVAGGLGILLLLPIGAMALLASNVDAYFMAAIASTAVLVQQVLVELARPGQVAWLGAGTLGTMLFIAALSVRPLANRLLASEALVRRQEVDLANLAQLSQYIVQHLRESLLVVDEEDRIRLINDSAAAMLGAAAVPDALLGECSPRLLFLLTGWRRHGHNEPGATFTAADGAHLVEPHFARLGNRVPAPVIVFLEDITRRDEKAQQARLAAMGRLSASIAHEIRNPVGAMSHAGQLLAESPALPAGDRRLTQIIRDNGARVSRIIENVLELSRRGANRPERLDLGAWVDAFHEEYCSTTQLPPQQLQVVDATTAPLEILADPSQLRQVLWNLCQNAFTHGCNAEHPQPVQVRYGRLSAWGRPYLEVADSGPGIPEEETGQVFEPFFTRAARGTGLGLYLARELAEANGATLLHEPRPGGGSVFRLVFTDPARWES